MNKPITVKSGIHTIGISFPDRFIPIDSVVGASCADIDVVETIHPQ